MSYQVAVVGTGDPDRSDRYAMAYRHGQAYESLGSVSITTCADIVRENAEAYAAEFDIDDSNVYEAHETMLAEKSPDIVSVCTPPKTHADIVIDAANAGVRAVHCEKPMAGNWQDCREMVTVCENEDVQLTFNHQRRFAAPYTEAKELLDAGRIGDLQRLEIGGHDLYDYGTHLFDLCGYLTDQTPVSWVLAAIDHESAGKVYGLHQENEAVARWRYSSGVDGFASTGEEGMVRCQLRAVGSDGVIEIGHKDGPPLRVRTKSSSWHTVDTGRDGVYRTQRHPADRVLERVPAVPSNLFSAPPYVSRGVKDIVDALDSDHDSRLRAEHTLQATEIIFACWESARQGQRISLPLEIDDNPLERMVAGKQTV